MFDVNICFHARSTCPRSGASPSLTVKSTSSGVLVAHWCLMGWMPSTYQITAHLMRGRNSMLPKHMSIKAPKCWTDCCLFSDSVLFITCNFLLHLSMIQSFPGSCYFEKWFPQHIRYVFGETINTGVRWLYIGFPKLRRVNTRRFSSKNKRMREGVSH